MQRRREWDRRHFLCVVAYDCLLSTHASSARAAAIPRKSMPASIVIQKPAGTADQLILLFHGVGSNAQDLVPVGQRFAAQFPAAMVVSLEGVQPCDFGQGRQWFSVSGVTEESRPARVAAAMPAFQALIENFQKRSGVPAAKTTLIGFSQGSIMSLESTQLAPALAGHVIAFSGRFAKLPAIAPASTAIHLIHGDADPVIAVDNSRNAARQLLALGAQVSLDIEPGMGHGINPHMLSLALAKLPAQD
jgi:phospholipase/carboxylesterase